MDISTQEIYELCNEVLEDGAFLSTTLTTEPVTWPNELMVGTLEFDGANRGEIRLTTTPEVCRLLAESMLGVDPESAEVALHARAALGEVLNIVAGALLARVFGTQVTHNLHLPRVLEAANGTEQHGVPTRSCSMLGDDGQPIAVSLYLHGVRAA